MANPQTLRACSPHANSITCARGAYQWMALSSAIRSSSHAHVPGPRDRQVRHQATLTQTSPSSPRTTVPRPIARALNSATASRIQGEACLDTGARRGGMGACPRLRAARTGLINAVNGSRVSEGATLRNDSEGSDSRRRLRCCMTPATAKTVTAHPGPGSPVAPGRKREGHRTRPRLPPQDASGGRSATIDDIKMRFARDRPRSRRD
jgi:hypothetical protein